MPAKDIFHDLVKRALQQDGWAITQDANLGDLTRFPAGLLAAVSSAQAAPVDSIVVLNVLPHSA